MLNIIPIESEMKLKLSASVMAFSTAILKLKSSYRESLVAVDEDEKLLNELENAYMNISKEEVEEIESLAYISFEADKIQQRLEIDND